MDDTDIAVTEASSSDRKGKRKANAPIGSAFNKKARARPTLSCTECVRRRQKCDRTVPCATCISRGVPEKCFIEELEDQAPAQVFALASDHIELRRLVEQLQDRVQTLESNGQSDYAALPMSQQANQVYDLPDIPALTPIHQPIEEDREQAAFALESLALSANTSAPSTINLSSESDLLALPAAAQVRRLAIRQAEIDFVLALLPEWRYGEKLVEIYFEQVAWESHIIHRPSFEQSYATFKAQVEQRSFVSVDFAWCALYFMVMATGLYFSPKRGDAQQAQKTELINSWVLGSQKALEVGQYHDRPSVSAIQTVLLMPHLLMSFGQSRRWAIWLATGLRMAQLLGLHETAVGYTQSARDREIGRRLNSALANAELNFTGRWLGLGSASTTDHDLFPMNLNDHDLSAGASVGHPLLLPTEASYQIVMAKIAAKDAEWLKMQGQTTGKHVHYETILLFDRVIEQLRDELPDYFRIEHSEEQAITVLDCRHTYLTRQRCLVFMALNNRLMRSHRHFLERGYRDRNFAYSTDLCIKTALANLACQRFLVRSFETADLLYHSALCCLSSAIVLLVDNLVRITAVPSPDLPTLDAHRQEGSDTLSSFAQLPGNNKLAQKAISVLTQLLEEEAKRRTSKGIPLPLSQNPFNTGMQTPRCEARTMKENMDAIFARSYVPNSGRIHQAAPSYVLLGVKGSFSPDNASTASASHTAIPPSADIQPDETLFAQLGIQFPYDMAFEKSLQQSQREATYMTDFGYGFM